jgi:hypothetical protein
MRERRKGRRPVNTLHTLTGLHRGGLRDPPVALGVAVLNAQPFRVARVAGAVESRAAWYNVLNLGLNDTWSQFVQYRPYQCNMIRQRI